MDLTLLRQVWPQLQEYLGQVANGTVTDDNGLTAKDAQTLSDVLTQAAQPVFTRRPPSTLAPDLFDKARVLMTRFAAQTLAAAVLGESPLPPSAVPPQIDLGLLDPVSPPAEPEVSTAPSVFQPAIYIFGDPENKGSVTVTAKEVTSTVTFYSFSEIGLMVTSTPGQKPVIRPLKPGWKDIVWPALAAWKGASLDETTSEAFLSKMEKALVPQDDRVNLDIGFVVSDSTKVFFYVRHYDQPVLDRLGYIQGSERKVQTLYQSDRTFFEVLTGKRQDFPRQDVGPLDAVRPVDALVAGGRPERLTLARPTNYFSFHFKAVGGMPETFWKFVNFNGVFALVGARPDQPDKRKVYLVREDMRAAFLDCYSAWPSEIEDINLAMGFRQSLALCTPVVAPDVLFNDCNIPLTASHWNSVATLEFQKGQQAAADFGYGRSLPKVPEEPQLMSLEYDFHFIGRVGLNEAYRYDDQLVVYRPTDQVLAFYNRADSVRFFDARDRSEVLTQITPVLLRFKKGMQFVARTELPTDRKTSMASFASPLADSFPNFKFSVPDVPMPGEPTLMGAVAAHPISAGFQRQTGFLNRLTWVLQSYSIPGVPALFFAAGPFLLHYIPGSTAVEDSYRIVNSDLYTDAARYYPLMPGLERAYRFVPISAFDPDSINRMTHALRREGNPERLRMHLRLAQAPQGLEVITLGRGPAGAVLVLRPSKEILDYMGFEHLPKQELPQYRFKLTSLPMEPVSRLSALQGEMNGTNTLQVELAERGYPVYRLTNPEDAAERGIIKFPSILPAAWQAGQTVMVGVGDNETTYQLGPIRPGQPVNLLLNGDVVGSVDARTADVQVKIGKRFNANGEMALQTVVPGFTFSGTQGPQELSYYLESLIPLAPEGESKTKLEKLKDDLKIGSDFKGVLFPILNFGSFTLNFNIDNPQGRKWEATLTSSAFVERAAETLIPFLTGLRDHAQAAVGRDFSVKKEEKITQELELPFSIGKIVLKIKKVGKEMSFESLRVVSSAGRGRDHVKGDNVITEDWELRVADSWATLSYGVVRGDLTIRYRSGKWEVDTNLTEGNQDGFRWIGYPTAKGYHFSKLYYGEDPVEDNDFEINNGSSCQVLVREGDEEVPYLFRLEEDQLTIQKTSQDGDNGVTQVLLDLPVGQGNLRLQLRQADSKLTLTGVSLLTPLGDVVLSHQSVQVEEGLKLTFDKIDWPVRGYGSVQGKLTLTRVGGAWVLTTNVEQGSQGEFRWVGYKTADGGYYFYHLLRGSICQSRIYIKNNEERTLIFKEGTKEYKYSFKVVKHTLTITSLTPAASGSEANPTHTIIDNAFKQTVLKDSLYVDALKRCVDVVTRYASDQAQAFLDKSLGATNLALARGDYAALELLADMFFAVTQAREAMWGLIKKGVLFNKIWEVVSSQSEPLKPYHGFIVLYAGSLEGLTFEQAYAALTKTQGDYRAFHQRFNEVTPSPDSAVGRYKAGRPWFIRPKLVEEVADPLKRPVGRPKGSKSRESAPPEDVKKTRTGLEPGTSSTSKNSKVQTTPPKASKVTASRDGVSLPKTRTRNGTDTKPGDAPKGSKDPQASTSFASTTSLSGLVVYAGGNGSTLPEDTQRLLEETGQPLTDQAVPQLVPVEVEPEEAHEAANNDNWLGHTIQSLGIDLGASLSTLAAQDEALEAYIQGDASAFYAGLDHYGYGDLADQLRVSSPLSPEEQGVMLASLVAGNTDAFNFFLHNYHLGGSTVGQPNVDHHSSLQVIAEVAPIASPLTLGR